MYAVIISACTLLLIENDWNCLGRRSNLGNGNLSSLANHPWSRKCISAWSGVNGERNELFRAYILTNVNTPKRNSEIHLCQLFAAALHTDVRILAASLNLYLFRSAAWSCVARYIKRSCNQWSHHDAKHFTIEISRNRLMTRTLGWEKSHKRVQLKGSTWLPSEAC